MDSKEQTPMTISNFTTLAERNTSEAWAEIDQKLTDYCNSPEFLAWARGNLSNSNSGLKDLAATILEASDTDLEENDIASLLALMKEKDEDNPYPSFRASCALSKRHTSEKISPIQDEIKGKLSEFVDDPEVSDIAKSYLDKLN